jgi:holo-[acyl-carrier protein] synthase
MGARLSVGMDLIEIARIQASVDQFGERFLGRVFTRHERDYAGSSAPLQAERLAARFAAKEAALKALGLADQGVAWCDMEVFRQPDGRCELRLHDRAAELGRHSGLGQTALSLSHDGGYAAAIVAAIFLSEVPQH